jgi:hypothetical protein
MGASKIGSATEAAVGLPNRAQLGLLQVIQCSYRHCFPKVKEFAETGLPQESRRKLEKMKTGCAIF